MSKLFNITAQQSAKVLVVKIHISGLSDVLSMQTSFIKKGFSKDDILYYSLFDKKMESIGVAELRLKMLELADFLKVHGNINLIVDEVGYLDTKGKYIGHCIFGKVFGKDVSAWQKQGVFLGTIDDISIKFIAGLSRPNSIKREMESKKLIDSEFIVNPKDVEIREVSDLDGLKGLHNFLKDTDEVLFDIETSSLKFDTKDSRILCLQFGKRSEPLVSYVVWYEKTGVNVTEAYKNNVKQFMQKVSQKPLVAHNASSFDIPWICWHFGLEPLDIKITDTLVLTYIARNSTRKQGMGLKEIVFELISDYDSELDNFKKEYLKEHKMKDEDFCYDFIPKDILVKYSAWDITALAYLLPKLEKECKNHIGGDLLNGVFKKFYQPYCSNIASMTLLGVPFDLTKAKLWREDKVKRLNELNTLLLSDEAILKTQSKIVSINYKKAMLAYGKKVSEALGKGKEFKGKKPSLEDGKYGSISFDVVFNPNSTEHKRILFFDTLGLKSLKKTEAGLTSVDGDTAIQLAKANPDIQCLGLFSEIAKLTKELSSFYDPYIEMAENSLDGRIRGSFRINGTISGRLSQTSPNLLQVPSSSDFKYLLSFPEDSDYFILGSDITNLEGNLATMLSGDKALYEIKDYADGDAHSYLGINLTNKGVGLFSKCKEGLDNTNPDDIAFFKDNYPKERKIAKQANFSCIFGIGGMGLAMDLGISREDGQEIVDGFWETHYGLKEFFNKAEQEAIEKGCVELFGGLFLLTPDANHPDTGIKSQSLRSSNNAKIQSGSRVTHDANVWFANKAKEEGLDAYPILEIHDALYAVAHRKDLPRACILLEQAMCLPFMENQPYLLQSPVELGKSLKGGYEVRGKDEAEKIKFCEEWLKEH